MTIELFKFRLNCSLLYIRKNSNNVRELRDEHMTIEKQLYENILRDLVLGNPIAEFDTSLEAVRVDTPTFQGVLNDRYDIVTGRKGAGKTAIYRLISHELAQFFLNYQRTVILSGVNSAGESIFNHYKSDFSKFDEQDFETFWKFYIITLIYNRFIKNRQYEAYLVDCTKEIEIFKKECSLAGIPDIKSDMDLKDMIGWVLNIFKRFKVKGGVAVDTNNPNMMLFTGSVNFDSETKANQEVQATLYVDKISEALLDIFKKSNLKVWVVLDRLDEVFERFSMIEFNGLRGLLRAYKSFELRSDTEFFRLKLFLRDDIKKFLTDSAEYKKYYPKKQIPPLAAATHIFAKESPVLTWTQDEIEQLILLRLIVSREMKRFLGIDESSRREDISLLLRDKHQRQEYWNRIFPEKISTSNSLNWMYNRLKDSNGVVTPRSVIDMLNGARDYQLKSIATNYEDSSDIFPSDSLKAGMEEASVKKLELDIYNEFPMEQDNIKLLGKYGKHKLNSYDLKAIYGKNWESVAESLRRIGILRYVLNSKEYMVEFVFRPALNITYRY